MGYDVNFVFQNYVRQPHLLEIEDVISIIILDLFAIKLLEVDWWQNNDS